MTLAGLEYLHYPSLYDDKAQDWYNTVYDITINQFSTSVCKYIYTVLVCVGCVCVCVCGVCVCV